MRYNQDRQAAPGAAGLEVPVRTLAVATALMATAVTLPVQSPRAEPYARLYFDNQYRETLGGCFYPPGTQQTLYVVLHDLDMWVWAVEFRVYIPPSAMFVTGIVPPYNSLAIGNIDTGISIAWTAPQSGAEPILALEIRTIWLCDCWTFLNEGDADNIKWIRIEPARDSGNRGVVRWPDFAEVDIGYRPSVVGCPIISTEQSTWGRVKALYR